MAELLLGADMDVPLTDYATLPPGVAVVLGYVGQDQCTPHVWTPGERQAVLDTGRDWWPIWAPPQDSFARSGGAQAANMMTEALHAIGYPEHGPVFLDIEAGTYRGDPAACMVQVRVWRETMAARGWPLGVPYLPVEANIGWRAQWVDVQPSALPPGILGWQFTGSQPGHHYDLSVFDPTLAPGITTPGGPMATLDAEDKQWLVGQLGTMQGNLLTELHRMVTGHDGVVQDWTPNLTNVLAAIGHVGTEVAGLSTPSVDVNALASGVAQQVGPGVADSVVAALAAKLG